MLAPIAVELGRRYRIGPSLIALMVVFGVTAVPAGPPVPVDGPGEGGAVTATTPAPTGAPSGRGGAELLTRVEPWTPVQVATVVVILVVAVLALVFRFDIGTGALVAAVALNVVAPGSSAGATKRIGWNVILLICGIVAYVDLLDRTGAVDAAGGAPAHLGSPLLAVVAVCLITGLTSMFASSAGILVASVPLLVPILLSSEVHPVAAVTALAICTTIVDIAPFSSSSALLLASTPEAARPGVQSTMLRWGSAMVVVGPVTTGLLLVALPAMF